MTRALVTALRTLTVLPIPGRDSQDFTRSLPFFPLAGALLGALLWGLHLLLRVLLPGRELIEAVVLLAAAVWVTGGLHLDGLADVLDAFGGGRKDRERILRILKDTHLGVFGAAAVALDLLLKAALYAACLGSAWAALIPLSLVFSRLAQAFLLAFLPYARGKEGTAFPFAGAGRQRVVLVLMLAFWFAAGLLLLALMPGGILPGGIFPGGPGAPALGTAASGAAVLLAAAVAAAGLPVLLFARLALRRIGGITGDCLGAANELFEAAFLLAGLILGPRLLPV